MGIATLACCVFSLSLSPSADERPPVPDLGLIRFRDPTKRRSLWLGLDLGGAVIPKSLGLFDRTVWTAHGTPAWSFALLDGVAIGGRHGVAFYDAGAVRLRVHEHQLELSAHPARVVGHRRLQDRLAFGIETHNVSKVVVDGDDFRVGGLRDTIATLGYGIDHALPRRISLGWQIQIRQAWVLVDTQRQIRAALRASFRPGQGHLIAVTGVAYGVNRDRDQAGNDLPRNSLYGQGVLDYGWISRVGVGLNVTARVLSDFRSGEAPVYEIREEALNTVYGELLVGLRVVWD